MKRCWRYNLRPTKKNRKGERVLAIGMRVGYWPCLNAPYIQVAWGYYTLEVWHGFPSYKATREKYGGIY